MDHFVIEIDIVHLAFLFDDRYFGFESRRLYIGHEAPFEATGQTLFEACDLFRRFVGGKDDLLFKVVKFIESMEKLFLCLLFVTEKLYIIDKQKIALSVLLSETIHRLIANIVEKVIQKLFTGRIDDGEPLTYGVVADRLHQMGFPKTAAAVDKEGIVLLSGGFGS
jgi:hypothetical protein